MNRFIVFALTAAALLVPAVASAQPAAFVQMEPQRRELWQIQRALGDKLDQLEAVHERLADLSGRQAAAAPRLLKDLSHQALALGRELRALQNDLQVALRGSGPSYGGEPSWDRPRPVPVQPPLGYAPLPLQPSELGFVLKTIDDATFPSYQLAALNDAIQGGAFFGIAQAQVILGRFPHETHKVEAAVMLCPLIVERGALPHLLSGFSFESYKQELRDRTQNQCGWLPRY